MKNWRTKRVAPARVQLAQQNLVIQIFCTVCRGFSSSFDYCSAPAARRFLCVRIAQVPQCLTTTSLVSPLTSRSSQVSSAAPARSQAPLVRTQGTQDRTEILRRSGRERQTRNIDSSGRGGLAFRPRCDLHLSESS
jgi:hypothetical protein